MLCRRILTPSKRRMSPSITLTCPVTVAVGLRWCRMGQQQKTCDRETSHKLSLPVSPRPWFNSLVQFPFP
jgi:hypothetical protein